ncbi:MAG: hypothetical protein ACREKE_05865, partial [bacterium]
VPAPATDLSGGGLQIGLGNGASVDWNGWNDQGQAVAPGVYLVQVTQQVPGRSPQSQGKSVTVLDGPESASLTAVWLAPDPAPLSQGGLVLGLGSGPVPAGVSAVVYDLLGQRVARFQPQLNGYLVWTFKGREAPGIYLVRVLAVDATGRQSARVLKVALVP